MILQIQNLTFEYQTNKKIFKDINITLKSGDSLTILGENGVGKTTLIKCLLQISKKYIGDIFVDNIDIKKIKPKERAKIIGFANMNFNVFSNLKVLDYISLGYISKLKYFEQPNQDHINKIIEISKQYNLEHLLNKDMNKISQGEGQLVNILRVLVQNPKIIVFDEPTSALDIKNQKMLLEVMKTLVEKQYIIIQVSHNPNHAIALNGKLLLLGRDGYIFGTTRDVLTKNNLENIYQTTIELIENEGTLKVLI